jgi:hypothetical protein
MEVKWGAGPKPTPPRANAMLSHAQHSNRLLSVALLH